MPHPPEYSDSRFPYFEFYQSEEMTALTDASTGNTAINIPARTSPGVVYLVGVWVIMTSTSTCRVQVKFRTTDVDADTQPSITLMEGWMRVHTPNVGTVSTNTQQDTMEWSGRLPLTRRNTRQDGAIDTLVMNISGSSVVHRVFALTEVRPS